MKHLAAYCLLVLSGKADPAEKDITALLKDVGATADKESLTTMLNALKGKKVHDLVRDGQKKLVSAPAGGVAVGGSAPAGDAKAAAKDDKKEKKEDKPAEEEANVDMGGLFGDDY